MYVQLCVCLCVYACAWTSCVCASVCVRVRVDMYAHVWSLLFCNVNVYYFHSYHYWHGYTVHNDIESMVLFLNFHAGL